MIGSVWSSGSWIFWFAWMAVGLAVELVTVFLEKKKGTLPLTRVVRDRLMRKHTPVKIGVMAFLGWLLLHFLVPLDW